MNTKTILITGGSGYIGSHVASAMTQAGYNIVVLDRTPSEQENLVKGDCCDEALVFKTIKEHGVTDIMHLAATIKVEESVSDPIKYYQNNVFSTHVLLKAMREFNLNNFIFSSTAAVYGALESERIDETQPCNPASPYGHSKLMSEQMIRDCANAYGFNYAILRYFNVAGWDTQHTSQQIGESKGHLISQVCRTALALRDSISIFGQDYETSDGTCVRDFIHVADIADIHTKILAYLYQHPSNILLNCGYGQGYSVKRIIEATEALCGHELIKVKCPRRNGDVPVAVADNTKLLQTLDWRPKHNDLSIILQSSLEWERELETHRH